MPEEVKPEVGAEEQVPEDVGAATPDDQAETPDGTVENAPVPAEGPGAAAGGAPAVESDEAAAEAAAEAAMRSMLDQDSSVMPGAEGGPHREEEFPDLSHVKMEEPKAHPAEFQQLSPSSGPSRMASNIDLLLDVKMPVAIELGRTELPISEILNLGPGSVVELDKLAGEPVDLLVNDKVIAKGEVVVVDENFGVRITMLMSPEERLKSLAQ